MPDTEAQKSKTIELTIQGLPFTLEGPYNEGDVLSAVEANVLNQTYAENVRNNFAATIKRMKAAVAEKRGLFKTVDGKQVPDADQVESSELDDAEVTKAYDDYLASYEFGARRAGGIRTPVDPVEKEARRVATQKVKELLSSKGYKVSDIDKDQMAGYVNEALEMFPEIREQARATVANTKALDLSALKI